MPTVYINKQPVDIELVSCCMGELNTTIRGDIQWPIVYGVGTLFFHFEIN